MLRPAVYRCANYDIDGLLLTAGESCVRSRPCGCDSVGKYGY
jgi:hypothetical protein